MRHAAAIFALFLLSACATIDRPDNPFFSSLLSKEDIAEITALVAGRSDIRQPIYEITALDARRNRFVVHTGPRGSNGATLDYFTVQKIERTWRIVSPVSHETANVEPIYVTQSEPLNRSNQAMERTAGSFGS
jgi:hypothetical protein